MSRPACASVQLGSNTANLSLLPDRGFEQASLLLVQGAMERQTKSTGTKPAGSPKTFSMNSLFCLRPAGFCGETEEEHADTLSLLADTQYEQAFMFAYSLRERTHAARHLHDDVPEAVKQRRLQEVIATFRYSMLECNRL